MSFDQSLCIKTFIDDEIFKGNEQLIVKNELVKIFSQSSQLIENPFSLVKPFVPNTDILKNLFAHGIFYFSKLMEIKMTSYICYLKKIVALMTLNFLD